MKAWLCYAIAAVLGLLGLLVIPSSVRDASRLMRLEREGVPLMAGIVRIEERTVRRTGAGQKEDIHELATLRYEYAGKTHENQHSLPAPIRRHQMGQLLAIVVLEDEPGRSYALHELSGNRFAAFAVPVVLLAGGAMFGAAGRLVGSVRRSSTGGKRGRP